MNELQQGMPPITEDELFVIMDNHDSLFDLPTHFHPEYEIEMILDGRGNRVIGDLSEDFDGSDVVLIGPNLQHSFHKYSTVGRVVTILINKDILDVNLLSKRTFHPIKQLLLDSRQGISFEGEDRTEICRQVVALTQYKDFEATTALMTLLNTMAHTDKRLLVKNMYESDNLINKSKSRRIAKALSYIKENLGNNIRLADVAALVNMSESSFSHFFRKRTGMSYIQYVNDQRVAKACTLLANTTMGISEICYSCGFNNYSNFIRTFSKRKDMTPSEYRIFVNKNKIRKD